MALRRRQGIAAVAAVGLLLTLAACGGASNSTSSGGGVAVPGIDRAPSPPNGAAVATSGGSGSAAHGGSGSSVPGALAVPTGPQIVRTGSLNLTVRSGLTVSQAAQRVTDVALGAGGYVGDSQVSTGQGADAQLTLDVPSSGLALTMSRIGALRGVRVTSTSQQGQDVSGEVANLGAELTSLQDARSQYLVLLSKASNIGAVLAVQDRIDSLQTEIQQLQAQQRDLNTQVAYAALSVSISAPGVRVTPRRHGGGWGRALHHAWRSFVGGLQDVVGALGALLLALLVLAALGVAVVLGLRVGRRIPSHVRRWSGSPESGADERSESTLGV